LNRPGFDAQVSPLALVAEFWTQQPPLPSRLSVAILDGALPFDVMKEERGLRSSCSIPSSACSGCSRCSTAKEAPVSEFYEGRQFVGMDLHRRRSVLVRMTETGEHRETVRILNDREVLAEVLSRAGESPQVVLEATYGWVRREGA
jgi:hypothetical protein